MADAVEVVARAICRSKGSDPDTTPFGESQSGWPMWQDHIDSAKAALAAMRTIAPRDAEAVERVMGILYDAAGEMRRGEFRDQETREHVVAALGPVERPCPRCGGRKRIEGVMGAEPPCPECSVERPCEVTTEKAP